MSSLWKKAASIFGYLVSSVSQMRATLVTSQSAGSSSSTLIFGILRHDSMEALRAPLSAGVAERALGHDDRALAVDSVDQRLGDGRAHKLVVRSEVGKDIDGVERRDQRIHVDDRNAGVDHLVDRGGQGADAERLNGDEIPLLRGHVVDRRALLDRVELAVEPGDVDVEQLAPIFGRLLALRAPGRLQSGVGESGLERLFRPAGRLGQRLGHERTDPEPPKQSRRASARGRCLEQLAAISRNQLRIRHCFLPATWRSAPSLHGRPSHRKLSGFNTRSGAGNL